MRASRIWFVVPLDTLCATLEEVVDMVFDVKGAMERNIDLNGELKIKWPAGVASLNEDTTPPSVGGDYTCMRQRRGAPLLR